MTTASPRNLYTGRDRLPGGFDPRRLRHEFPIFASNPDLVFLDSGASAQKPASVIDCVADYYRTDYANVHRGVYRLSARSTELFEEARDKVQRFLNAADPREIVFVRGATEAINLVAQSWGTAFLKTGDEVLISELEHHSNIVPWQMLRDRLGIRLVVAPIDATGGLDLAAFAARLSPRTRLVAITHIANATGALVPIETIVELAHRAGAKVLVDGCQAAPRLAVDVQALGCDFYAFSGHKTYGPDRDRRALRPPRPAVGDAALARRRRDDPQRHLREDRVPGPAASLRGRHPRHFGCHRARRGARFHRGARPRQHPRA